MNKTELTKRLAERVGITVSASRCYLNTLLEEIENELADNNNVDFHTFGSLRPWHQTERLGRNPQNGIPCPIKKRTSIKFRPGTGLLKRLNSALILFLLIATGCTSELPTDSQTPQEEWLPVEVASVQISDMQIEEIGMGGKGTKALPNLPNDVLIQTEADLMDLETEDISLFYTLNGVDKEAWLVSYDRKTWEVIDNDTYEPLTLPRNFSGTITARISYQDADFYDFNDMRAANCPLVIKDGKWALTIPFKQVTTGVAVDVSGIVNPSFYGLRIKLIGKDSSGSNKELRFSSSKSRLFHYIFLRTPFEKDMTLKIELVQTEDAALATKTLNFTSTELSNSTKNNNGDFYTIKPFTVITIAP